MSDTCRSCGAPILWAETPKGRRVPLDPEPVAPDDHGALLVVPQGYRRWAYGLNDLATRMGQRLGISEREARIRAGDTYKAHLSHFATCPNAGSHRRTNHE